MKKFLLLTLTVLAISCAYAQEGVTPGADRNPTDAGQVPQVVRERFTQEYPGISGSWSEDGDNFRVEFVDPQSHLGHIIVYDRNGDVIRRESELDGPSQPNAINEYYRSNYPGEQLKTWSVKEKDGSVSYYTHRNKEILRFDSKGNPARQAEQVKKRAVNEGRSGK